MPLIDHDLKYEVKSSFNQEINQELDYLKGRVKKISEIQEMINKKFGTNFDFLQIRHSIRKLMQMNFGKASLDAFNFIKLCEEERQKNKAFFEYELDNERKFRASIFASNEMLILSQYFTDFVLVDSTYKRNRFNLPLVNVVGVDNFGRTVMLAFGMIQDETIASYNWFFEKLKKCWNKDVEVFICDEDASIHQGILINFLLV